MSPASDEFTKVSNLRQNYESSVLVEEEADPSPILQFQNWLQAAVAAQVLEPNAMTLATVHDGQPAARIVLLKDFDERGFVFYTNFLSQKGQALAQTPAAALVFWWGSLERQVRIEGRVVRVSEAEADAYFQSRPLGSQLGAWASHQSQMIEGREGLEQRLHDLEQDFQDRPIPRPDFWGGYRVEPHTIEFWQGRPNRLHDRLCYRHISDNHWKIERLSP